MQKNLGCFEKRGKKGQFYLIAAAIIVFVVINSRISRKLWMEIYIKLLLM